MMTQGMAQHTGRHTGTAATPPPELLLSLLEAPSFILAWEKRTARTLEHYTIIKL
jgi:hypothetical protein